MDQDLILFICTGNTCRSPMAEALLRQQLHSDSPFQVASAGLNCNAGNPIAEHSNNILKQNHIDHSQHRSQPLSDDLLQRTASIFCLSHSHRDQLLHHLPELKDITHLVLDFSHQHQGADISDPYGGSEEDYQRVFDQLQSAIPNIAQYLNEQKST